MQSCLCTWCNAYGGRSVRRAANDGVVFSTVSDDKDEPKKGNKKKRLPDSDARRLGTM